MRVRFQGKLCFGSTVGVVVLLQFRKFQQALEEEFGDEIEIVSIEFSGYDTYILLVLRKKTLWFSKHAAYKFWGNLE